jgi:predicted small lipoprotein YifL
MFVWCGQRIGDFVVTNFYRLTRSGRAIILVSALALALGGCGRKGPLDLPPTASAPPAAAAAAPPDSDAERAAQPGVFNPTYGSETGPVASKGTKKSFILDPILNSN